MIKSDERDDTKRLWRGFFGELVRNKMEAARQAVEQAGQRSRNASRALLKGLTR